jgi:hypothetical protein
MHPSALLEAVVIVALSVAVLWPVRLRLGEIAAAIPRRYVLGCLLLWMAMLGGQMATSGKTTYPFPDWDLYTASIPNDPRFVDYMAELSSGREVRLLIGELFPAGGRYFRAQIDHAVYATESGPGGSVDAQAASDLDAFLAGVTRQYNARHPQETIRSIRLWVGTVPARNYHGPGSISRHFLREYHPQ